MCNHHKIIHAHTDYISSGLKLVRKIQYHFVHFEIIFSRLW